MSIAWRVQFAARTADGDYLPLAQAGLSAAWSLVSGSGAADDPQIWRVTITNGGEPFSGVVRLSLPLEAAEPRFFLPGFMYGTNRGEAPLVTDSRTPRLRR